MVFIDGPAGLLGLGQAAARVDRRVDPRGHVLDAHQHVQFQVGALQFLVAGPGVEAVGHVVLLLRAELLQGVDADVMVGHHQPVGGDERARAAAVEADGGPLQVGVPLLRRREVVVLLEDAFLGGLLNSHMPSSARAARGGERQSDNRCSQAMQNEQDAILMR